MILAKLPLHLRQKHFLHLRLQMLLHLRLHMQLVRNVLLRLRPFLPATAVLIVQYVMAILFEVLARFLLTFMRAWEDAIGSPVPLKHVVICKQVRGLVEHQLPVLETPSVVGLELLVMKIALNSVM